VLFREILFVITVFVLIIPPIVREFPIKVDTARVDTFAIVLYKGNPKVFTMFQVLASREVNVIEAYGCEMKILLVPSIKVILLVVLTMIDCGDDRKPKESRTVTFRPGGI
jgi:hypothetical protein